MRHVSLLRIGAYIGIVIVVVVLANGFISGCVNRNHTQQDQQDQQVIIATTFFPLFEFTRAVAGENARVVSLISSGVDPHSYEPSASNLRLLADADLLVILGIGDRIEQRLLAMVGAKTRIIHAAAGIALLATGDAEQQHDGGAHDAEAHGVDIHVWLSLRNAMAMTRNIAEGLITADIDHASEYQSNSMAYTRELSILAEEIMSGLGSCEQETIITTHDAYRYFAEEYGINIISIYGAEPDAEPSSNRLITLIESARTNGIEYIFYEELLDRRIPQIIANEIGATLLPLHPLEYAQAEDTYLSLMRENGRGVSVALQCQ